MAMKAREHSLTVKLVGAGSAACIADVITFPLDVAKVRLQIQGEGVRPGAAAQYRGVFGTILTIARKEGPRCLYNGLVPGLQRQACFATVRIGFYDGVRDSYSRALLSASSGGAATLGVRILAGITTGGLAVVCAQPTDVVKVRMQAQSGNAPKRYANSFQAYKMIARDEGMKGLYKGTLPNVARNAIVNAAELVCYDSIKEQILKASLMSDNMPCHFVSAFAAGFCATVVASPVDVVKTRYMNSGKGQYTGALDCAVKMFHEGGPMTFYKGFMPSFIRLGSWNICMFVTFEQLKRLLTFLGSSRMPAEVHPAPQQQLRNVDLSVLPSDPRLTAHSVSFAYFMSSIVDNLDDPQTLTELVRKLARNHCVYTVGPEQFGHMSGVLVQVFHEKLGTKMSQVSEDGWKKMMEFVVKTAQGVEEEREHEKQTTPGSHHDGQDDESKKKKKDKKKSKKKD